MEEELKRAIYQNTVAILSQYQKLASRLKTLPANPDLQQFLANLNGILDVYNKKYPTFATVNLRECKTQYEPVVGLNKVEQAFNSLEEGFYALYPNPAFANAVRQLLDGCSPYYDRLNATIAKIPA